MKSIFSIFKSGLQKTTTAIVRNIQSVFTGENPWTPEMLDDLEAILIQADLGVQTATEITDDIRERYKRGLIATAEDIRRIASADIRKILEETAAKRPLKLADSAPTVIFLVGVNGTGKTTTTAKLAHLWKKEGKSVMLAACDTFRAGAIDQLQLWGERTGCEVVASKPGADAAAVVFDAVAQAVKHKIDVLLVDTAGRQHTRKTLMDELGKIHRTAAKACPGAPHEVWLTVDASLGTNAVTQAREFGKITPVTGLIVTKLDGTGKGGSLVPITRELGIPVYFTGLGEQMGDLQPFSPEYFADALFAEEPG